MYSYTEVRLTEFSEKGGCGCKLGPKDLNNILKSLPQQVTVDDNLLVGNETSDDAGVYKITDEIAIVQTVDFFTPIVDDPFTFGQIAAANALSDIYAMGGTPKTALNIVGFPIKKLGSEILLEILRGASSKVTEAGAVTIGGHTIDDSEPKFGLSVTGLVNPNSIWTNSGSKPGDALVLTKPIGMGIITTGIKRKKATDSQISQVIKVMTELNKNAAEKLRSFLPNAVTDVTGFGLLGHALEIAKSSNVTLNIFYNKIPMFHGTHSLAKEGIIPGGTKRNYEWLKDKCIFDPSFTIEEKYILCDANTSGGLLISMPAEDAKKYVYAMQEEGQQHSSIIGYVEEIQDAFLKIRR